MKTEKIKICYVVSSLANEGPVNVMFNIIKFIDFSTFNITIVTLVPEKEHSRMDDFMKLDIEVIQLSTETPTKGMIGKVVSFRKLIKKINPNIIHSHCPRSLIYINFLPKKYKRVYTAHIFPGIQQIALYGNFKGKIIIKLCNFLMMRMDLPIACSESVSKEFLDHYAWKIKAIPNGCSLDVWKMDIDEKLKIRKSLELKEDITYFLFIGRFSEEKKPEFLVEAFEKLNDPQIQLIMLGTGPLFDNLNYNENTRVKLEGFKTDILPYLKASDYYVSASQTEGLANTLLESMSVGLPLLLSNIPSHNGVISNSTKEIGVLFDNSDETDFINKINHLMSIQRDTLSENVLNEYTKKYTAQTMAKNHEMAYKTIVN
jgi:glycosyltransferase involved in cell wall biosynthesis